MCLDVVGQLDRQGGRYTLPATEAEQVLHARAI
jgi:hypothetical protein